MAGERRSGTHMAQRRPSAWAMNTREDREDWFRGGTDLFASWCVLSVFRSNDAGCGLWDLTVHMYRLLGSFTSLPDLSALPIDEMVLGGEKLHTLVP